MYEIKLPVYHTNDYTRCCKYIYNNDLIISKDVYWLGTGMYFWDNQSNAEYWKTRKVKNINISNISITKSQLSIKNIDNFLDLTDVNTVNEITKLFHSLNLSYKTLGTSLDNICLYLRNTNINIDVIKIAASYPNTPHSPLFPKKNNDSLTNRCKIIYCVKNNKLLTNRIIIT